VVYPGNYEEYLWSKKQREQPRPEQPQKTQPRTQQPQTNTDKHRRTNPPDLQMSAPAAPKPHSGEGGTPKASYEDKKKQDAEGRRLKKAADARQRRIAELEARIAKAEAGIKEVEAAMSAPGFYENHETAKPIIDRHQALMWEVGDLMNKWEALQSDTEM